MRSVLNVAAVALLCGMLVEPALTAHGVVIPHGQDLALVLLGLAGVMLGRRGGYRVGGA